VRLSCSGIVRSCVRDSGRFRVADLASLMLELLAQATNLGVGGGVIEQVYEPHVARPKAQTFQRPRSRDITTKVQACVGVGCIRVFGCAPRCTSHDTEAHVGIRDDFLVTRWGGSRRLVHVSG
jgi:hypothetical protein